MANNVWIGECDFCGEDNILVATSPKGVHCKDCWSLIRDMADEAIWDIEMAEKEKVDIF